MDDYFKTLAQFILISVGLGLLITFNDHDFIFRLMGLIMFIAGLDWRYRNG